MMSVRAQKIKIIGEGNKIGFDGFQPMRVECIVAKEYIVSMTINN